MNIFLSFVDKTAAWGTSKNFEIEIKSFWCRQELRRQDSSERSLILKRNRQLEQKHICRKKSAIAREQYDENFIRNLLQIQQLRERNQRSIGPQGQDNSLIRPAEMITFYYHVVYL